MTSISITETDILDGVLAIETMFVLAQAEGIDPSQRQIQNMVLGIFRQGLFKGLKASGAVIIKDETQGSIWKRLFR